MYFKDFILNLVSKLFIFQFEEFYKLMQKILNKEIFVYD